MEGARSTVVNGEPESTPYPSGFPSYGRRKRAVTPLGLDLSVTAPPGSPCRSTGTATEISSVVGERIRRDASDLEGARRYHASTEFQGSAGGIARG